MNSADFRIKVLPDSLILIEANGYTSEVFKPFIVNGEIKLFNLVASKENAAPKVYSRKRKMLGDLTNNSSKAQSISAKGIQILQNITLPSTQCFEQSAPNKTQQLFDFSTPDIMRRCMNATPNNDSPFLLPGIQSTPLKRLPANYISTPQLGPNVKVVRLHRKPTSNTPQKAAKIIPRLSISPRSPQISSPKIHSSQGSVMSPGMRPIMSPGMRPIMSPGMRPIMPPPPPPPPALPLFRRPQRVDPPPTITKWRKCITPHRTYSRLSRNRVHSIITPGIFKRHQEIVFEKAIRRGDITQGFYGDALVQIKRIPAKIDAKVKISPVRFKAQMKDWSDITKTEQDDNAPKTKTAYFNDECHAFRLITRPTRLKCCGEKLQRMFRKRCVQKRAPVDRGFRKFVEPLLPLEEEEMLRPSTRRQLVLSDSICSV